MSGKRDVSDRAVRNARLYWRYVDGARICDLAREFGLSRVRVYTVGLWYVGR